jgi:uncharacterized membrane protein
MADETRATKDAPKARERIGAFDVFRGFSVISMVLFHYCYDVRYIAGNSLPFFEPPLQDVWRCSISWAFVFIAGCMSVYSRDNLRRSLKYMAVAAGIYVATSVLSVDTPISFGIIYCMGACTLVAHAANSLGARPRGWLAAALFLIMFVVTLHVSDGYLGAFGLRIQLPNALYSTEWASWLGFPGPRFASGDYYPVIPFTLMYLVGAAAGRAWSEGGFPEWFSKVSCPPLEAVGRHALPIYLIHQPAIIAVLELIG